MPGSPAYWARLAESAPWPRFNEVTATMMMLSGRKTVDSNHSNCCGFLVRLLRPPSKRGGQGCRSSHEVQTYASMFAHIVPYGISAYLIHHRADERPG